MPRQFTLPDGRTLIVPVLDASEGDTPDLGPLWELSLTGGSGTDTSVGHPLNSALAELLGYRVAHEEWPSWIDELSAEIEPAFGVSS